MVASAASGFDGLRLRHWKPERRDDGVSTLEPWAEKQSHRSLLYRHLWRHGRSMSVGYSRDKTRAPNVTSQALTIKFQWEV